MVGKIETSRNGDHPRVSVIIPAYNPGALVIDAIESVLAQTFQNFEIIVIDDASTDATYEQLRVYGDRIRYVRQNHSGPAVARNRGVLLSCGQYIAFLDADDIWMPEKLEKQLPLLEQVPKNVLVYSDFNKTSIPDENLRSGLQAREHWVEGKEFQSLLRQNFIHMSSVLVRKDALAEAGLFDPKFTSAEDWDLWIRLADVGSFGFVDEILSHYRVHEDQSVNTLKFARNVIYSDHVMLARWRNDLEALQSIRSKTGKDYYKLGRREWRHGNRKNARDAFWQSAKFNERRLKSLGQMILCLFPAPVSDLVRRGRNGKHGVPE